MMSSPRSLLRCLSLSLALAAGCGKEQPPTTTPEPAPTPTEAPAAAASSEAADEVLAEALEAAGGRDVLDAVETSYTESTGKIPSQGLTMDTRTWAKGQDFYMEMEMPGVGLTQTWKVGDKVWSKDPINGMRELEGDEAWQTQWSSDPLLFARWRDYFDEAKLGKDGDGLVDVVFVKGDKEVVISFAKDTHLQRRMQFEQTSPVGTMTIKIEFDDHREVDGMKIPFKTVTDMQLVKVESEVVKFETNVDIDPDKLKPPVG